MAKYRDNVPSLALQGEEEVALFCPGLAPCCYLGAEYL